MSNLTFRIAVCVVVGWLSASAAAAGDLHLQILNGRVTLRAKDVSVREILGEWARVGAARVVNADKVLGGPITLELTDVPEKQALDIILRSVSGYMAAPRPVFDPNQSVFDRILILATSSAPASAPPRSAPAAVPPQLPAGVNSGNAGADDQDDDEDVVPSPMPGQPAGVPGIFNFGNPQQGVPIFGNPQQVGPNFNNPQAVPIPAGAVPVPVHGPVTPIHVFPGSVPPTPNVTGYPVPQPVTGSTPSPGTVAPGVIVPSPPSPTLSPTLARPTPTIKP